MAGDCHFEWDCRVIPGDSALDILEEFTDRARGVEAEMRSRAPGCRVETEKITNAPAFAPTPDNPAANLAKTITGANATDVVPYATEAGQFQEAGFSTVVCGPGSIDQAHQPDEFISINQVEQATVFLRKLIARLAA
jgi:acetylornithine deacetylase